MESDSRAKMVQTAAALIAARGISRTSFSEVVDESGAPRGSIYHHFPDGKQQLAEEAVRWVSDQVLARQRACDPKKPADVLDCFFGMWRRVAAASKGASGCAVAGTILDSTPGEPDLIALARGTFRSWIDVLRQQLEQTGVPKARAAAIATAAVAGMEGALILCRAEGNVKPLDTMAAELHRLIAA